MKKFKKVDFNKYKLSIIITSIVLGVFMLAIGFSVFGQKLAINMAAEVRVPADIRVTGIVPNGTNNGGLSNSEDYNVKNINGNITLPSSDSSVTYKVEVTNFEGPEMGIFSLTGLPDNLEYELKDYELKEKICDVNGQCRLGIKKEFEITIKYKSGQYNADNTNFNFKIDFDFRSYHTVTYKGFSSTSGYPTEIMDGDNLNVTFNETIKKEDLYVTVGGVSNTNFTVSGAIFALNNIKNDVVITNFKFYVEASVKTINFPRTTPATDYDNILTETTNFTIKVKNNDGTNYNHIDGNYKVEVIDSSKFALSGTTTGTIKGGSKLDQSVNLSLNISKLEDPSKKFKLRVTSTSPITKTVDIDFTVTQDGAIQYVEDLVDMSLAIRGKTNPKNLTVTNIQGERFKLTRNLDFSDKSSYENPTNTAYGDINGNETKGNVYEELTSDTGFLPIGELDHPFQGVFNGGDHTISHLTIQKSLQINIGFFGTTNGATVKNLTLAEADVTNHNQTAGIVVGKVIGGTLDNLTVSGKVVSLDEVAMDEDTYTGGIAGYVTANATISNCINKARVSTNFTGDAGQFSGPAGGITAWMAHSIIDGCKNYGEVSGESYIGGIAGFSGMQLDNGSTGGGTIQNCENHGYIHYYNPGGTLHSNWGKHIGGIAGYNKKDGVVTANTNATDARIEGISNVGGIVGNNAGNTNNNDNYSDSVTGQSNVNKTVGFTSNTGTSTNNRDH